MVKNEFLFACVHIKILKWAHHVMRIEDYHILKKILGGRPRSRWEDNTEGCSLSAPCMKLEVSSTK